MSCGLIIGKFLPLHKGHCFLIDMAQTMCDELYIFLCSRTQEAIPGTLRIRWITQKYPLVKVIHITKEIENAHAHNPDSPQIWSQEIKQHIPHTKVDFVFTSEQYGNALAKNLEADLITVDPQRSVIPTSGKQIRNNLYKNWEYLSDPVKADLVKIIGVDGVRTHILTLITSLGALHAVPYSYVVHAEHSSIPIHHFKIASKSLFRALAHLNYPVIVYDYSHKHAHEELSLTRETYEKSLLHAYFRVTTAEDVKKVQDWWKHIIARNQIPSHVP